MLNSRQQRMVNNASALIIRPPGDYSDEEKEDDVDLGVEKSAITRQFLSQMKRSGFKLDRRLSKIYAGNKDDDKDLDNIVVQQNEKSDQT